MDRVVKIDAGVEAEGELRNGDQKQHRAGVLAGFPRRDRERKLGRAREKTQPLDILKLLQ